MDILLWIDILLCMNILLYSVIYGYSGFDYILRGITLGGQGMELTIHSLMT